MSIYVEARIHGPLEELWEKTQTPSLHEKWDLRFTSITYLPRASEDEPQLFRYETRIGFGLAISGTGETVGKKTLANGERASALKFWSEDPKSLITEGSGYWKYVPLPDGSLRFFTEYRYDTRFGAIGRLVNTLVFEPLMGWATAWSFDRLRLWIEKGIPPAVSLRQSLVYAIARLALAFVFFYHGLVPKLILHHPDEIDQLIRGGIPPANAPLLLTAVGIAEIAFALVLVVFWRARWPLVLTALGMIGALVGVALTSPQYLGAAFNPVTLNAQVFALAVIAYIHSIDLPTAAHCLRKRPPKENPL
jgi:hypothetical protein